MPSPMSHAAAARARAAWPWAVRAVWLAQLAALPAVSDALDGRSGPVRATVGTGAWLLWGAGLVASLVPSTASLTVLRTIAPVAPLAGVATWIGGAGAGTAIAAVVAGALACVVAFAAEVGERFVQASAYGDEARLPLRPPAAYLVPATLGWALMAAAVAVAAIGLASGAWIPGAGAAPVALATVAVVPRRLHALAQRWLVFVPAGVVVHDKVVLAETLLLSRRQVRHLCLAPAGTGAADLTGPAAGHAVEIALTDDLTAVRAPTPAAPRGTALHLRALLVAPSRPGHALAEAGRRGLPLGG